MNWIQEHQALLLVAWPLFTAIFSVAYKYADSLPRVHAALSVLSALGIDLPKLWEALGRLFTGNPPSGGGKLTELPGPMIKGAAPKPPGPPTAARKETLLFPKRLLVGAFALVLVACGSIPPPPPTVIQDFGPLLACIGQHMGSIEELVANCSTWTLAEIEAGISWLLAHPSTAAEHPDWMPKLQALRTAAQAKIAAAGK